ncbi:MAG: hypothetical protein VX133_01875, partial [Pseudomonadota bacterium]|nr:hypothetical protein [Pseudomonadota bacterium]
KQKRPLKLRPLRIPFISQILSGLILRTRAARRTQATIRSASGAVIIITGECVSCANKAG